MSGYHHLLAREFGVPSLIKEKGYFVTTDGTRQIRKTKDSPVTITARYQLTLHCMKNYPWMEKYYLAKNGQPYALTEGDYYIMTDHLPYPEADFSNPSQLAASAESLALWHKSARDISFSDGAFLPHELFPLTDILQNNITSLGIIRKRIRRQSQLSDFDVLFIKNFDKYKDRIVNALELLKGTNYLKRFENARNMNYICHGSPKENCIRIKDGKAYITKLDNGKINYQLNDLCIFIRRAKKAHDNAQNTGQLKQYEIIEAYNKVLPLEPDEEIILQAMLLYPSAFVKIVFEYYQKKRTWIPVSMLNKMREVLST